MDQCINQSMYTSFPYPQLSTIGIGTESRCGIETETQIETEIEYAASIAITLTRKERSFRHLALKIYLICAKEGKEEGMLACALAGTSSHSFSLRLT